MGAAEARDAPTNIAVKILVVFIVADEEAMEKINE